MQHQDHLRAILNHRSLRCRDSSNTLACRLVALVFTTSSQSKHLSTSNVPPFENAERSERSVEANVNNLGVTLRFEDRDAEMVIVSWFKTRDETEMIAGPELPFEFHRKRCRECLSILKRHGHHF